MADMNIRFISTSTVRPSIGDHHGEFGRRIDLSPIDLQFLTIDHMQKGLLFDKPTSTNHISLVDRLKAALSRTLDSFYPLAGRLTMTESDSEGGDGSTASFFIDCNGAGTLFVHAAAEAVSLADVLELVDVPVGIVSGFFRMNGVLNCEAAFDSGLPLVTVQVTELADGVFVGCSMNHVAADGECLSEFFKAWSEASHDNAVQPHLISRPVFGREYFQGFFDLPVRIPLSRRDILSNKFVPPSSTALHPRVFRFSEAKIAELKAKANTEMKSTTDPEMISSLQALLAHFWVCTTRGRRLNSDEEVTLSVMVGLRPRLEPPLPEDYRGNAVNYAVVKCTAGELLRRGMSWAARRINRAIVAQATIEARKLLGDWAKSPRLAHLGKLPQNLLAAGSSPRFNMYGNDFGWGRPLALRTGAWSRFDGKMLVHPGPEEGSIDLEVCLFTDTLRALDNDAEFTKTLSAR